MDVIKHLGENPHGKLHNSQLVKLLENLKFFSACISRGVLKSSFGENLFCKKGG